MSKLVSSRISSQWQQPYVKFISDFVLMLNTYNERVSGSDERLTEAQMRSLLEAAVSTAKPLYEVTRSELLDLAKGNPRFTLAQYIELLYSTAALMDAERKTAGRTRAANLHFGTSTDDDEGTEDDQDLRAFLSELKACAAKKENDEATNALRVDNDTWVKLQVDSRRKWATIPQEDKEMILGALATKPTTRAVLNANVADTSTQSDDETATQPEEKTDGDEDDSPDIQANMTSSEKGKVHPAALARMMASKKKPALKKGSESRSANTVKWHANAYESKPGSKDRGTSSPFLDELEKWGTTSMSGDELDIIGTIKEEEDDDPFNLKALMDEGDADFW